MKESLSKITNKIAPLAVKLIRYKLFIFFIVLLLSYGFIVFRINSLNNLSPTDNDVTAKLKTVTQPHIDQSAIDKIKQLNDNSVQVKTLLNNYARNNPFSECIDAKGHLSTPPNCAFQ